MTTSNPQLVIQPEWLVPVIPEGVVLTDHALVISEHEIVDLLPVSVAQERYPDIPRLQLDQQLLIPGLINTHGHGAMTLLRGYADDRELMDWLNNHIWPVEGEFVNAAFVTDGTSLAIAEMLLSGTTCAADTYFFPDAQAKAYENNHFRAQCGLPVIQFPNAWARTEEEHIHKALQVHDEFRHSHLIQTAFAPHAPYTVTDVGFEQVATLSEQLQIPIHLHLHETLTEVNDAIASDGRRPFKRMQDIGLLTPLLQSVHMTQLLPAEVSLLAQHGVHVATCPESNLKLASGFCPVAELLEAGVNVAIGTDGAASNNNLDMLEELRTTALIAKGLSGDATKVSAHQALAMATINGARLLGLEDKIGSLEPGKLADLTAIDLSAIQFQPVYHPVSQLVYTSSGHQVSHVWVNGRMLVQAGELTEIDVPELQGRIKEWGGRIGQRVHD